MTNQKVKLFLKLQSLMCSTTGHRAMRSRPSSQLLTSLPSDFITAGSRTLLCFAICTSGGVSQEWRWCRLWWSSDRSAGPPPASWSPRCFLSSSYTSSPSCSSGRGRRSDTSSSSRDPGHTGSSDTSRRYFACKSAALRCAFDADGQHSGSVI